MSGWIVEVEDRDGALLYAARVEDPSDAEDIVRKLVGVERGVSVFSIDRIDDSALDELGVAVGEIRGPM